MKITLSKLIEKYEAFYNKKVGSCEDVSHLNFEIQGERVKALVKKKNKKTFEVKLSNGEIIFPSEDHKFMVNGEEKLLSELSEGQLLDNNISIVYIKFLEVCDVIDFSIEHEDEIYTLAGVRHHNTPIPKNIYIIFASNMDNSDGCWAPYEKMDVSISDPNIRSFIQKTKNIELYKDNLIEKKIQVELLGDYVNGVENEFRNN